MYHDSYACTSCMCIHVCNMQHPIVKQPRYMYFSFCVAASRSEDMHVDVFVIAPTSCTVEPNQVIN